MLTSHQRLAGLWAALVLGCFSAACASSGATPRPFPAPRGTSTPAVPATPPPPVGVAPRTGASASAVVDAALALRGIPYRNGGSDLSGFDCSGFTQYVFASVGIRLPRETRDQYGEGDKVRLGRQQPGDLVFFSTVARGPSHVGIAVGGDAFVHAPSSRGVVRVESLNAAYWSKRIIGIRRLEPNESDELTR